MAEKIVKINATGCGPKGSVDPTEAALPAIYSIVEQACAHADVVNFLLCCGIFHMQRFQRRGSLSRQKSFLVTCSPLNLGEAVTLGI